MENRTRTYLVMAHLGFLAALGLPLSVALDWPDFVRGLFVGMLLLPLAIAPLRRMRDEYIDGLWQVGTSWAFIVLLITFIFGPFLQGIWEGLHGITDETRSLDQVTGYCAILAFYVAFHVKWLADKR